MFKKIFTTFILAMSLTQIAYPLVLNAQAEYTVLAPLPGTTKGENKTDIKTYVEGMFKLLIALSAVFAVFMIVVGGFQYMTSDAIGGKQEGRDRIENSIKGLILVIGAWLILAQIDDRLLTINLDIKAANVPAPSGGGGGSGGLSTTGLQRTTQTAVDALRSQCSGCVNITSTTGGQHTTNSAHYQGRAVDLAANAQLTNFITGQNQNPRPCQSFNKTLNGINARFIWEPRGAVCGTVPSSGDHWHMDVAE